MSGTVSAGHLFLHRHQQKPFLSRYFIKALVHHFPLGSIGGVFTFLIVPHITPSCK
jgi:hypothetical protein